MNSREAQRPLEVKAKVKSYLLSQLSQPVGLTETKEASENESERDREEPRETQTEQQDVRTRLRESKVRHCILKRKREHPSDTRAVGAASHVLTSSRDACELPGRRAQAFRC